MCNEYSTKIERNKLGKPCERHISED